MSKGVGGIKTCQVIPPNPRRTLDERLRYSFAPPRFGVRRSLCGMVRRARGVALRDGQEKEGESYFATGLLRMFCTVFVVNSLP